MNNKKRNYIITIIVDNDVRNICLNDIGKNIIKFGRSKKNDIIIDSPFVSKYHGYFKIDGDIVSVFDNDSKNGILYNEEKNKSFIISNHSYFRIDNSNKPIDGGVLIIFSIIHNLNRWHRCKLSDKKTIKIGKTSDSDIILEDLPNNNIYTNVYKNENGYFLEKGPFVKLNGKILNEGKVLKNRDVININNVLLIYNKNHLLYQFSDNGIKLEAEDIVKTVKVKGKNKDIAQHISMSIMPGEFVSLIGGSGTGKTTFIKCISGLSKPTSGNVYLNGIDLYTNYEVLKKVIGYVPQDDIVFNDLTLIDMLKYSAYLRMPDDASEQERNRTIREVISTVELEGKENIMIKNLSGGQRKRASIAVELLADPKLFFLDEPTSGLDPGTERKMMKTLRKIADQGRTVILVTHNTLNLHLCDKVVFFGEGGRVCFSGSPENCFNFFECRDFINIYNLVSEETNKWYKKYLDSKYLEIVNVEKKEKQLFLVENDKKSFVKQFITLTKRYIKMILNNKKNLAMTILLAPIIAAVLVLVADDTLFGYYAITRTMMFCFAIASIFMGLSNSIQEICKERVILNKEYMADLKISSYLSSKIFVMLILSIIQSILLVLTFSLLVTTPTNGLILEWRLELIIECCITIFTSSMLGLFVSSFASDNTIAMTYTPLLMIPQLVLCGMFFELVGKTKILSYFIISKWSLEMMGTTSDLNSTITEIEELIPNYQHEASSFFEFSRTHLYFDATALILLLITFLILCYISLRKQLVVSK